MVSPRISKQEEGLLLQRLLLPLKICKLLDINEDFQQIAKEMVHIERDEAKKIISKMVSKIQSQVE